MKPVKYVQVDLTIKFWGVLSTRELGQKTFSFIIDKYLPTLEKDTRIVISFSNYQLLTPSYLDESIVRLLEKASDQIYISAKIDDSIKDTLEYLMDRNKHKDMIHYV